MNLWIYKAKAGINPATGKPYQIGETKVRPDGTKWVKTGTFSWAKAGTKDAEEAKKKTDTDGDGKAEKKEIEGQSSKDAEDILGVYGEKGLYQLTKAGMYNLLLTHGVDDPKSLKWAEKVEKVKEIVKEIQEHGGATTIKTQGKEEFTEEDYHILHNSDLVGNASSLDNTTIHTRNGDVTLKFTKGGGLSDETYDELMQKVDPIEGGHWGSAETGNDTALSVALVNAPDWKPINQMQNGMLAKYDQQLSDTMYEHCLVKGIGLRKYAQEKLKHPDMSRERIPNFYRGMTVDASQYEQILAGEVDTIELTGCTAVTSFEAVADQYASSQWTKGFGEDRRSIKLIIERDDYMDNSIGMFHHNTKGYAHGNKNIAFELLTGSPSFYIKSVQKGGDFDIDKSADSFVENNLRGYDSGAKERYDSVKNVDIAQAYQPNGIWKYEIKNQNGNTVFVQDSYYRAVESLARLKAKAEIQDLNEKIVQWSKDFYKNNAQDFFSRIKNGHINHKNNDEVRAEWNKKVEEEWQKSDLYKEWSEIRNASSPQDEHFNLDRSVLPDEAHRKEIDEFFNNASHMNYFKKQALIDPLFNVLSVDRAPMANQYDRWRGAQDSKKGTLTMKMFLDKRKPLEKSYKTQVDKTEKEYEDFDNFYKWRDQVLGEVPQAQERIASEIQQKYGLTDAEMDSIIDRRRDGSIRDFYTWKVDGLQRLSSEKRQELEDYLNKVYHSKPVYTSNGIAYDRGYGDRFDPADNPFISDELKKSPYFTKSEGYPKNRYEQLVNIRKNYENAKRENELIAKYDIYNTPKKEIQSKLDESDNRYNNVRGDINKYLADSWLKKQGWDLENLLPIRQEVRDKLYKGDLYYLNENEREDYYNFKKDLEENDKEYQKLEKQIQEEFALGDELIRVLNIYKDYNNKLASMHKSSRPLEVHVVCGRGKKSMTAGADDQLEEQDDGDNQ